MTDTPTPPPASSSIPVSAADAHRLAEALSAAAAGKGEIEDQQDALDAVVAALSAAVPAGPAGEGGEDNRDELVSELRDDAEQLGTIALNAEGEGNLHDAHMLRGIAEDVERAVGHLASSPRVPVTAEDAEGGERIGLDLYGVAGILDAHADGEPHEGRAANLRYLARGARSHADRAVDTIPGTTPSPAPPGVDNEAAELTGWRRHSDTCSDCNYDTHTCQGCGEPVSHDEGRCCRSCALAAPTTEGETR